MEYTLPTTKEEMFSTLQTIFNYYRTDTDEYTDISLDNLSLVRLTETELTDEQLSLKAEKILAPSNSLRILERKEKLEKQKLDYENKINEIENNFINFKTSLTIKYNTNLQSVIDKFLSDDDNSSMYLMEKESEDKKYKEELEKEQIESNNEKNIIQEKINDIDLQIENCSTYFSDLFEEEKTKKFEELKENQEKQIKEKFKYNNILDEKEQRYNNTVKQSEAALKLKHLSIKKDKQTKEELVVLGYYSAVLDVCSAYYNSLSASLAFDDIKNEKRLLLFLDDYYNNFYYNYYIKSLA